MNEITLAFIGGWLVGTLFGAALYSYLAPKVKEYWEGVNHIPEEYR